MNKFIRMFVFGAVGALMVFLAFAFGEATFGIQYWGSEARGMCGMLMLFSFGVSVVCESINQ